MALTDLNLANFRSYTEASFEFSPSVNIIVGPNASGKTNLLESVLLIARGKSYRASDPELIKNDKNWARLESHDDKSNKRKVTIKLTDNFKEKQFVINDQVFKRLGLNHTLPIVLFEPNHLQLLNGSPELRRQFMDEILTHTKVGYNALLAKYRRALAQRNALLKQRQPTNQLFAWNIRLSELGEQLTMARKALTDAINENLQGLYQQLSGSNHQLTLAYQTTTELDNYASKLIHQLESHTGQDMERGYTAHGPHRDELVFHIHNRPLLETASRGEIRTLLLVLKMIEAKLLEQARQIKPILLFDDVFSELDGKRRQALTTFLKPYQTFITTTDADLVIQHFTETTNIIPIASGR